MFGNIFKTLMLSLLVLLLSFHSSSAQTSSGNFAAESVADSVVSVINAGEGQSGAGGSGLVVRSDGYILTAYHLVKGARDIQVRLRNGEIYDKAEIIATDERRDVTILRINAVNLHPIPNGITEEGQVGAHILVVANLNGQAQIDNDKLLNSVQLADNIAGAGKGFRVLQFDRLAFENSAGALVLDENGHTRGIVTTNPDVKNQNIAVPFSSILGLIRSTINTNTTGFSPVQSSPSPANTPYPIPQNSVQMPQRGVTPLAARGPGSSVIKPVTPKAILEESRTIYVTSETDFFKPDELVNALGKREEIADWGLSFVEDRDLADLILELDHITFTYKFTFKLYSQRLGSIIATGDVIIFDGNLGSDTMAKRVIEKIKILRGEDKKSLKKKEDEDKKAEDTKKTEDTKKPKDTDKDKPDKDKKDKEENKKPKEKDTKTDQKG